MINSLVKLLNLLRPSLAASALLFAFLHTAVPKLAGAQTFQNPVRISAGGYIQICPMADLNADGKIDIVEAGVNQFTPRLNLGNGTFGTGTTVHFTGLTNTGLMTVADVNGDGKADVVIIALQGAVVLGVALGNGDGTFRTPVMTTIAGVAPYAAVSFPAGIVAAPFLGSGHADLLITQGYAPSLYGAILLAGDGTGRFTYKTSPNVFGATLMAVDLNGDGKLDVISAASGAQYALNTGNGTFGPAVSLVAGQDTAFGALDRDGSHVFVSSSLTGEQMTLNRLDASGNLTTSTATVSGITGIFGIADVNGDGIPDLLTRARGLTTLLGQGGTRFAAPISEPGFGGVYLTPLVDMDGDGNIDLIYPNANEFDLLRGRGDGSFVTATQYIVGSTIQDIATGDFNLDGKADVAVTVNGPMPVVLPGNGTGLTAPAVAPQGAPLNISYSPFPLLVRGDFNGDGKPDLLQFDMSGSNGNSLLFLGKGDGSFQAGVRSPTYSTVVADLNNDGRTDILQSDAFTNGQGSQVTSFLGQADGSFKTLTSTFLGPGAAFAFPADYDHDGKLDVLFNIVAYPNAVASGNGDGSFGNQRPSAIASNYYTGVSADFDGDGIADLLYASVAPYLASSAGVDVTLTVYYGANDGTFTAGSTFEAGVDFTVGDLNGDGLPELVSVNNNYVRVYRNLGKRTFAAADLYLFGGTKVALADTNNDGLVDIITNNADTLTVLLNLGDTRAVNGTLTFSPEPSQLGSPVTATANFVPRANSLPLTGTVTFSVSGQTMAPAPIVNGTASVTFTPALLAPQSIQVIATYSGDSNYTSATVQGMHVITNKIGQAVLTLQASPASALRSQTIRLQATLTYSAGIPVTANVPISFTADAYALGTSYPSQSGTATLGVNTLAIGTHVIGVHFNGGSIGNNITLLAATGPTVSVTVSAHATATVLNLSSSSGSVGSPVTLNAAVISPDPVNPFGSVTFYDGAQALATVLLQSGLASITTASTQGGMHSYTAAFNATETFAASASATTSYVAQITSGRVIPVIASQSITSGDLVTLSASLGVSGAAAGHRLALMRDMTVLGVTVTDTNGIASLVLPAAQVKGFALRWITAADGQMISAASPAVFGDLDSTLQVTAAARAVLRDPLDLTVAAQGSRVSLNALSWSCQSSTTDATCSVVPQQGGTACLSVRRSVAVTPSSMSGIAIAAMALLLVRHRRRPGALLCLLLVAFFGLTSCGGDAKSQWAVVTVTASTADLSAQQQVLINL